MERIKLGKTQVELTRITFGAWAIGGWMWGGADQKDAQKAIRAAVDLGITSIDTAPIYGFGRSEEIVGEALEGKRDKVELLTKCGLKWEGREGIFYFESQDHLGRPQKIYKYSGKQSIIEECERSLKRLKTDYIDLYQVHWPDDSTPIAETMEALQQLLDDGKIRAAGVSNYSGPQMQEANDHILLASNQVPYSMVKRDIETEIIPYAVAHDIAIIAYSPLERGLLTGKVTEDYVFNAGDHRANHPHFSVENRRRVNAFLGEIAPFARDLGVSLSQLVINWTLQQRGITVALVGARNPAQVQSNAASLDFQIPATLLEDIGHRLSRLELASA